MGNRCLYLLQNAKNAHTPLFSRSDGQQPLILDSHCKVCTHLALPAALMGNNLLYLLQLQRMHTLLSSPDNLQL